MCVYIYIYIHTHASKQVTTLNRKHFINDRIQIYKHLFRKHFINERSLLLININIISLLLLLADPEAEGVGPPHVLLIISHPNNAYNYRVILKNT